MGSSEKNVVHNLDIPLHKDRALYPDEDYDVLHYNDDEKTKFFNKLLRGEMSAVQAYQTAINQLKPNYNHFSLNEIKYEHEQSVASLKDLIHTCHSDPSHSSGMWGSIVVSLVEISTLMGDAAVVKTLIEGEEHGLNLYMESFRLNLTPHERAVIEQELVPAIKNHIQTLEGLLATL